MIDRTFAARWLAAFALGAGAPALGTAPAMAQGLAAAGALQPGLWQIREEGAAPRNICVADAAALVQVRHAGSPCTRLVIANQPNSATVHYSCPGAGWGRTTLKAITPRSASIDTQGIADNAPFAFTADARRVGDCPSAGRAKGLASR